MRTVARILRSGTHNAATTFSVTSAAAAFELQRPHNLPTIVGGTLTLNTVEPRKYCTSVLPSISNTIRSSSLTKILRVGESMWDWFMRKMFYTIEVGLRTWNFHSRTMVAPRQLSLFPLCHWFEQYRDHRTVWNTWPRYRTRAIWWWIHCRRLRWTTQIGTATSNRPAAVLALLWQHSM